MDITSDLPQDVRTLSPYFALDDPLTRLQVMLNEKNIDVDNLDERVDNHGLVSLKGYPEERQQAAMRAAVNRNPEQTITSRGVRDLNERFDVDLDNSNPQFIFKENLRSGNNVRLIQTSNQSYSHDRDLYAIPPPKDVQQQILNLLAATHSTK